MLSDGKMIGFVPTKDAVQARSFYEGQLGFKFVSDDMFALVVQAGETMIRIAKAQDFTPAPYTQFVERKMFALLSQDGATLIGIFWRA